MRWSKRKFMVSAALVPLAAIAPGQATAAVSRFGGGAFGSSWRITVARDVNSHHVRRIAEKIIAEVDIAMSPYRIDSALSRFNTTRSTQWQQMPRVMCTVVNAGLRIAQLSGGAFDPAVGPLVGRYGFGPIRAKPAGHFGDISVRDRAVRKTNPDLCLDLCAIAKGFALDQIADAMDRIGIHNFLIEVGGEVRASGRHPDGRSWQVGIERPVHGSTGMQRIVRIDSMALATSADSVNFYESGGKRFSHLIDPVSQRPIDNGLSSVSVIATSAMAADGLATALMVLGPERGVTLARSAKISALFVQRQESKLYETMTADFPSRIVV